MATGASADPVSRLRHALSTRLPRLAERDEPFHEAAVALIVRTTPAPDDLELLLIRRAAREGDPWSGQIALPGGRHDALDPSLEATALRETSEELGLDLTAQGEVLGALDELRPRTPVLPPIIVRPYVCLLHRTPTLVPNHEVAEARWVRVSELYAPATRVRTVVRVRSGRMTVDALVVGDFTIWGMTERILATFAELWQ